MNRSFASKLKDIRVHQHSKHNAKKKKKVRTDVLTLTVPRAVFLICLFVFVFFCVSVPLSSSDKLRTLLYM